MIDKINLVILRIEDFLLSYITIAMAVLLVVNVFFRSVLNNSLSFAEELGAFFLVIITYIGISTAARFYSHINMNAVLDNVSFRMRKAMVIIISLFTFIVMAYLGYLFVLYGLDSMKVGRISTAMEIPMVIIIMILATGIFITSLQYLICLIKNITNKDEIYLGSQAKAGKDGELVYEADLNEFKATQQDGDGLFERRRDA